MKRLGAGTALLIGTTLWAGCGDDGGTGPGTPMPPQSANRLPAAAFDAEPREGTAPFTVNFDATASSDPDGSLVRYAWSFGDGETGVGEQIDHTFTAGGVLVTVLTVEDDRGGEASAQDTLYVASGAGSGSNTIEGTVWFDRDLDGSIDGDEPRLERFTVFLDDDGDGSHDPGEAITFTDENGDYRFAGLDAGRSYTVTQSMPFGWTNTVPGTGAGGPAKGAAAVMAQIYNGVEADIEDFPFQVALRFRASEFQFCGGTLISSMWVLTAAHCIEDMDANDIEILLGTDDLQSGGQVVGVTALRFNPAFRQAAAIDSDVGVILLDEPVLRPRAFLQSAGQPEFTVPGTTATVIGWGQTEAGTSPDRLRKVEVPILSNSECSDIVGGQFGGITEATICAGGVGIEKGPCFGDSGGPLLVPFEFGWIEVGIVSFGRECGGLPGVFARVSSQLDYIRSVVPVEESGSHVVDWSGGATQRADFANYH